MLESKETKTGAQIERIVEDDREKIIFHKSFYINIGLMVFATAAVCILFFFIIQRYEGFADAWNKVMKAAQPIIIGLVIAYLLNPIMKFWERIFFRFFGRRMKKESKARKLSRGLGIGCALLVLLLIIVLFIAAIAPSVVTSIARLIEVLPAQAQSLVQFIQTGDFGDSEAANALSDVLLNVTNYVETWAQEDLLPFIQSSLTSITTGVINAVKVIINFVIGLFVAAYVMSIQETLQGQSKKLIFAIFRPRVGNIIVHTVRKSSAIFGGFITGKIIDSAIIGAICYVGCLILHIPSPVLVAVIVGVTNVIPFFGPFIGAIPALLLVVIQSPWHALYLLIFIIVLQQADGNIIGPKILGNSTGLSSFWVMFAILVFGGIWGFFGMLLGVPTMAVIYYIAGKLVRHGLARRKLPTPTADYVDMRGVDLETNTLRYTSPEESEKEAGDAETADGRIKKRLRKGSHQ